MKRNIFLSLAWLIVNIILSLFLGAVFWKLPSDISNPYDIIAA
jgi:hypothetical protein